MLPPPPPSYASCVKDGGDFLSVQHGLQALSAGSLGNGWLSSALLGNSISGGIGTGGPGFVVELWVPRSFRCGGKGGVFDVIANPRSPYGINANQPGFFLRVE